MNRQVNCMTFSFKSGNMIYPGGQLWFTPSWHRHAPWMIYNNGLDRSCAPSGVQTIWVSAPATSVHWFAKQVPAARSLHIVRPASFFLIDSSSPPVPLVHVDKLMLQNVTPGLEFLLDGVILPNLRHIHSFILPLFVAFVSRLNQMRSIDEVDRLVLVVDGMNTFALKHYQIVLYAVPRLQSLIISFGANTCPPIQLADMLIDYVIRAAKQRLRLFSFRFTNVHDQPSKLQFIAHMKCSFWMLLWRCWITQLCSVTIDVWMY